jgi:hypothetical protein
MIARRETIYVALLDEGIEVWRRVKARRLPDGTYLILEEDYDRDTETWQFGPGAIVRCRNEQRNGRPADHHRDGGGALVGGGLTCASSVMTSSNDWTACAHSSGGARPMDVPATSA